MDLACLRKGNQSVIHSDMSNVSGNMKGQIDPLPELAESQNALNISEVCKDRYYLLSDIFFFL